MDVGDNTPGLPSDWQCGSSSLSSMVDSYVATVWENPTDDSTPLGFNLINAHSSNVEWQEPDSLLKGGLALPSSMPASIVGLMDSFSEFNQLITPSSASMDGSLSSDHRQQDTRCIDEGKLAKSDESDSGGPSLMDTKKRKRGSKDAELEQSAKEEYTHVRARRGQATNSHSLAERVRREKIRERMKFLQDLVPGCSKVTGKAVMLDEIINYVQSLQRQVEFLSMKLATVDPRMDLNIDALLAKERMFATRAGPSSLGLSLDMRMAYPFMNPSQPNLAVIGGSLRNLDSQLTSLNEEYKEPTPQMRNAWDDELQNIVQMGFNPSAPLDNQETPQNSSLPAAHMKAEL